MQKCTAKNISLSSGKYALKTIDRLNVCCFGGVLCFAQNTALPLGERYCEIKKHFFYKAESTLDSRPA